MGVLNLALIALAAFLLWDGRAWSLLGLILALTPTTLFLSSIVNPNGTEVVGAIAATAAVIRISRDRDESRKWVWISLTISCVVTMLTRQFGIFWVAVSLALLPALLGRQQLMELYRARRRPFILSLGTILFAAIAYLVWAGVAHTAHPISFSPFPQSVVSGVKSISLGLKSALGVFGWGTVFIKSLVADGLLCALAALIVVAAVLGKQRERLLLIIGAASCFAFMVAFYGGVYRLSGYWFNGRYVLGLLVVTPLLAGEFGLRHAGRMRAALRRTIVFGVAAIASFAQLTSWWMAARGAVSQGLVWWKIPTHVSWWLPAIHGWHPPAGWLPWMLLATAGSSMILAAALVPRMNSVLNRSSPWLDRLSMWRRPAFETERTA